MVDPIECSLFFMCGARSGDKDPVAILIDASSTELIRWGRGGTRSADGSLVKGETSCYACERTWACRFAINYKNDRRQFKKAAKKEKTISDLFKSERLVFVRSGVDRAGKCRFAKPTAVKKNILKTQTGASLRLIAPKDKFFLLEVYTRRFGNPKSKDNRAKGHRVVNIAGKSGVAVPNGEDPDLPWDLERVYEQGHQLESVLAERDEDDNPEEFADELSTMQADLQTSADADYAAAVQGQSFEAMMESLAAEDCCESGVILRLRVVRGCYTCLCCRRVVGCMRTCVWVQMQLSLAQCRCSMP